MLILSLTLLTGSALIDDATTYDYPLELGADFEMLDGILAGDERVDISHAGGEIQEIEKQLEVDLWGPPR